MKINIISDIHATLDADGSFKVLYAEKQKHTEAQCKKVIDALVEFAHSNKVDTSHTHTPSSAEKWLFKLAPTCHTEYLELVVDVASKFKILNELAYEDKSLLANELIGIEHWHHVLGVDGPIAVANNNESVYLHDVIGWLTKTFHTFDPAKLEPADYLVIAGDLGTLSTEELILKDVKEKTAGKFKDILCIAGNHSHWWSRALRFNNELPEAIDLSHDYCEHADGDWLFLGCTLWTPIPESARCRIQRNMNDYNYIPHFTPTDSNKQFEIQSTWLRSKVDANPTKKIVVFTHHQPFKELVEYDVKHYDPWSDGDVGEAYADLEDSLKDLNHNGNVKLWACGHTHMPFDKEVYNIRVVRNPIGYSDLYLAGFGASECDPKNWYNKVIDLGD